MNNKGFTLIELLGVIVLLGIISAIAIPSIGIITNIIKNNMLEKKVTIIEQAATLLGEDIKASIIDSNLRYKEYPCRRFIVSNLVPDYLDKDNDNTCLTSESEGFGCITDPSDNDKYLDKLEVIIYYKNKRINAKVDTENNLTCS